MVPRSGLLLAAMAAAFFPATVEAMQDAGPVPAGLGQASPASMVWDFEERCALCHDVPSPENRAPSREALRQMAPERVLSDVPPSMVPLPMLDPEPSVVPGVGAS